MKRIILITILVVSIPGFAAAQEELDLESFRPAFQGFADGVANTLPMASTIGLQWSDAYIKALPHFGIGLSAGAVFMPVSAFDAVFSGLGVAELPNLSSLMPAKIPGEALGLPFPGYALDFRIGGIRRPLDLGFKIGFIPTSLRQKVNFLLPPGWGVDYLLAGGDLRYAIIQENKRLKPNLSVGIGYNFLRGGIVMPVDLADAGAKQVTYPDKDNPTISDSKELTLEDPKMTFDWRSHVIDLKAQLSKRLFFVFTPYIGIGASYARSRAGGGLETELLLNGQPVEDETLTEIEDGFAAANKDAPELSPGGIFVESAVNGWALRGFGGFSINIFFLRLDTSIMYNLISNTMGVNANIRIQI